MCRSVEVLGFHHVEREVRILLALYVENKGESGTPNHLRMLHRGNVECFVQPAWPLPCHPDEVNRDSNVLHDIYGENFQDHDNQLLHVKALTAWDARIPVAHPHPVIPWSQKTKGEYLPDWGWSLPPELPNPPESYVPFTTWEFGPFTERKSYLITCTLRIAGKTYDELVQRKPQFSVDGPERLLSRIKYDDVFRLADRDRAQWEERLETFYDSRLLLGEGYDVIILQRLADKVERLRGSIGIAPAPVQPPVRDGQLVGERYVTTDPGFCMTLRYPDSTVYPAEQAEHEPAAHCY